MDLSLKNLKRQKDLLNKGVGIQKDMEEAEVNYGSEQAVVLLNRAHTKRAIDKAQKPQCFEPTWTLTESGRNSRYASSAAR